MPRLPSDNISEFLWKIAPYVYSDGARNLNVISHDLGIPYPTLRFRMLGLHELGIRVVPVVDTERIGLERVRVFFEIPDDLKDHRPFFGGLHQAAGLRYYARSLISQLIDCEFDIPKGTLREFSKFLKALEEMKFITNVVVRRLVWKDFLSMRTDFYDYNSAEWDVDFSALAGNPSNIEVPFQQSDLSETIGKKNAQNVFHPDHKDLLIIKSLEMDAWKKAVSIGEEIGVDPADVLYHMNKHIFERKLISSFKMKWSGTKDAWAKHKLIPLTFVFENLTEDILKHSMSVMTSTPFTWNHMRAEDGTYFVELLVPLGYFVEAMRYLSNSLRPLRVKPQVLQADSSCMSIYTIPYFLHDQKNGWKLSAETSLSNLLQVVKQYR